MVPRVGLEGRKISSPPGFDPGPSRPQSVAIPTELPGPHLVTRIVLSTGTLQFTNLLLFLFFYFQTVQFTIRHCFITLKHKVHDSEDSCRKSLAT